MISTQIAGENGLVAMLLSPVGVVRKAKVGIRASQKMVSFIVMTHLTVMEILESKILLPMVTHFVLLILLLGFVLIVIQQNGAKINSPKIC
jgi:hypothetical protein